MGVPPLPLPPRHRPSAPDPSSSVLPLPSPSPSAISILGSGQSSATDPKSLLALVARADNFYYLLEWTPKKGSLNKFHGQHVLRERAKKIGQGILIIRFEMPFNIWCDGCNSIIAEGVRFNGEKKKVGTYYSTKTPDCRSDVVGLSELRPGMPPSEHRLRPKDNHRRSPLSPLTSPLDSPFTTRFAKDRRRTTTAPKPPSKDCRTTEPPPVFAPRSFLQPYFSIFNGYISENEDEEDAEAEFSLGYMKPDLQKDLLGHAISIDVKECVSYW